MVVSDGTDLWTHNPAGNTVTVSRSHPGRDAFHGPYSEGARSLADFLRRAAACYSPGVRASEPVAGRAVYVINLGETRCPSNSAPELNGRRVLWIDRETFFLLKAVQYSPADGAVVGSLEVSDLRLGVSLDPALFTFTVPPGAALWDHRPRPAPSPAEIQAQLGQLAQEVDFPLFAPGSVPELAPRAPRLLPSGVELQYVPAAEAGSDSPAVENGILILQRKATPGDAAQLPGGVEGVRHADGSASSSSFTLVRDGTWIGLSSLALDREALVQVAASMSRTAELGVTELPARRPQPAVPPPRFRVLRPEWLPEQMTVREETIPGPPEHAGRCTRQ